MLKDKLQQDLKQAMIARDSDRVETLRGLKSAILYAEVASGKRDEGLNDDEIIAVFIKEAKKRQESIEMFEKGGNSDSADKEMFEKGVIDAYLPEKLSDEDLEAMVDSAIADLGIESAQKSDMGKIIGLVKSSGGAQVDGASLAKIVQKRIG